MHKNKDLILATTVSICFVTIYELLTYIPIPGVNLEIFRNISSSTSTGRFNITALGIMPLISGFFFAEILSFILPPLKKLRTSAFSGRKTITLIALIFTLILAVIHGVSILNGIENMKGPSGEAIIQDTSFIMFLVRLLTLITPIFLVWFFADNVVNKFGLGNGISLLLVYHLAFTIPENSLVFVRSKLLGADLKINYVYFIVLAFIIVGSIKYFFKTEKYFLRYKDKKYKFSIFPLPQGIEFYISTVSLLSLVSIIPTYFGKEIKMLYVVSWKYQILSWILLIPFSLLFMYLFTYSKRLKNNLIDVDFDENTYNKLLLKRTIITAFLLGALSFMMYLTSLSIIIVIPRIIILIAVIYDYYNQILLMKDNGRLNTLCELDNVHFANLLRKIFTEEKIIHTIQGFHHRSLGFFFLPHIKMRVLVAKEHLNKAKELLGKLSPSII